MLLSGFAGGVAQARELPALRVTKIAVGVSYETDGDGVNTWGKVLQVIDDDNMIVGIDNGSINPGGDPRYSVVVWCKFPTKGVTDGKTGFLGNILGTSRVTASTTTRYKTVGGGTRTVFLLEPYETSAAGKKADEKRAADAAAEKKAFEGLPEQVKPFVGRWCVLTAEGKPSSYLNISPTYKAGREHVAGDSGKWEFVGQEIRITYGDGWKSVVRPAKGASGDMQVVSFPPGTDPGAEWRAGGSTSLRIVRAGEERAAQAAIEKEALGATPKEARKYVGKWCVLTSDGKPSSYLRLYPQLKAVRDHVPAAPGEWKVVGGEVRITYSDGWHSVIRRSKTKAYTSYIASFAPGVDPGPDWRAKPTDSLFIVKQGRP
jgi:hypothetical protein